MMDDLDKCPECGGRLARGVRGVEHQEFNGRTITLFDAPVAGCLDCQWEFYGAAHADAQEAAVRREFPGWEPRRVR